MKQSNLIIILLFSITQLFAQNKDKGTFQVYEKGESYYYNTILKGINSANKSQTKEKTYKRFKADASINKYPTNLNLYKSFWHNPTISQGNTGTCWDFSTTSFYESEIKRLYNKEVKISEAYTFYCEYILKATGFVNSRGTSLFSEGSEGNAVARIYEKFGAIPYNIYDGLKGKKFHDHSQMYKEMNHYLLSVKKSQAWNLEEVINTIKSIMNHYVGVPPTRFIVDGKKYTPKTYLRNYLKINPKDYIEILSYKQAPYYEKCAYDVPDNWWHNNDYYNIPLDDFMNIMKRAIKAGYTMSIGGDVSEAGFLNSRGEPQVAIVPDFDIPSAYINDDARQFRFSNKTTTDDHGMHLVGYLEQNGKFWFLIKDSSSGSRNNLFSKKFGYYFFSEDFMKLKMMGFTIHKDAVKDILIKFQKKTLQKNDKINILSK